MHRALICTPTFAGCHPAYVTSLDNLRELEKMHWQCIPYIRTGSLITLARNGMAAHFLKNTRADVLMWIDSDEGFRAGDVASVVEAALLHGVCGGVYREKPLSIGELDWQAIANAAKQGAYFDDLQYIGQKLTLDFLPQDIDSEKGYVGPERKHYGRRLVRVAHCGTGFLAISREAMEKVYATRADFECVGGMRDCFSSGVVDGRYSGEDWIFCNLLRAAGFDIWIDTEVQIDHYGFTSWRGSLSGRHLREYACRQTKRATE